MPRSRWTPSIVPRDDDHSVYLVLDDLGRSRIWREAEAEHTDIETVIADLLGGQYKSPVRVIGFNTAEHWSQDVSGDVAKELRLRCAATRHSVFPAGLRRSPRRPLPRRSAAVADPPGLMPCLCCEGERWVCEEHPDQPWTGPHACSCGGAGMPCPVCNASSRDDPLAMPKGFEPQ